MVGFYLRRVSFALAFALPLACSAQGPGVTKKAAPVPRTSTTYAETVDYSFPAIESSSQGPANNLIQALDGNLWGTSSLGGSHALGNVFKVTPLGVYTDVFDFNGTNGSEPLGNLIVGHDGNLYGTTSTGGTGNAGTLFRISTAGVFTSLYSFSNGEKPSGGLVEDADSNFYGTTAYGGANGLGELFQYSNAAELNVLYSCTAADCARPVGGLVQASDGNGYGTSFAGGNGNGTIFKFEIGSGITVMHSFGGSDGASPLGALLETYNGLWGTTHAGGAFGDGVLFLLAPNGSGGATYTDVFDFRGGIDGGAPEFGTLTLGGDNNIYGATVGAGQDGTVFQYNPTANIFTTLYDFGGTPNGSEPAANPVEAADGTLWGTTLKGGASGAGTIYKITPSASIAPAITMTSSPSNIAVGGTSTISFAVNNAYSDTAMYCDGFINGNPYGQFPTSGSVQVTLTYETTNYYAFTCGGVETATTTVSTLADITFTSVTHNMGSVLVGTSTTGTANYGVKLTSNEAAAVKFSGPYISGSSEFSAITNCPASLPAQTSCEILFTFAPTQVGTQQADWYIGDTAEGTTFSPSNGGTLTGTGVAAPAVTLTSSGHNFGTVAVNGTSSVYGAVLTNSTTNALQMAYGSVSSPFLVYGDNCGSVLAAGLSCNLEFQFAPNAAGTYNQTLSLSATAGGSPVNITSGGVPVTGIVLKGTAP
jgi:uncharacterized repeat protein (TIGR03803 family)